MFLISVDTNVSHTEGKNSEYRGIIHVGKWTLFRIDCFGKRGFCPWVQMTDFQESEESNDMISRK